MLLIPSVDKWVRQAKFGMFNTPNVDVHHINIVAKKSTLLNIQVTADVPFTKSFDTTLLCDEVGVLTILATQGSFEIKSDSLFYSYVYSYVYSIGTNESFAYLTGAKVFPYKGEYALQSRQVCFDAQPITLGINSDSLTIAFWDMGDGTLFGGQSQVTHSYSSSGNYTVKTGLKLTSNTCPTDTLIIPVTVSPEVSFKGLRDSIVCPGEKLTYQLSADQPLIYTWQDNSIGSTRELNNVGKYIITATDTNGCFTKDSFILSDSGCFDKDIVLYNTITPNNDGLNDEWVIQHKGYSEIKFYIFDRWGKEVFNGDAVLSQWWDGKMQDTETECTEGTYYYHIKAQVLRTGAMEDVSGVITLIR